MFYPHKIKPRISQKGQHAVPVLNHRTGQQHTEKDGPLGIQGQKNQTGSGLRNKPHQEGDQQHEQPIGLHPSLQMEVPYKHIYQRQRAKCPEKYPGNMNFGDMLP